jgi:hypothetical protein
VDPSAKQIRCAASVSIPSNKEAESPELAQGALSEK